MPDVNWLAVLLCAASSMILGGLWYSPLLFARPWQRGAGLSDEQLAGGNMALVFGLAFVLSLIAAAIFAVLVGHRHGIVPWIVAGAAAGALVAASFGVNYLFERRSARHWLINGGYHFVQFVLFGLILAHFP
jgi:hypothetical protein